MNAHYFTDRYRLYYDVELAHRVAREMHTELFVDYGPARIIERRDLEGVVVFGASQSPAALRELAARHRALSFVCIVWNNLCELAIYERLYREVPMRFVVLDQSLVDAAHAVGMASVGYVDLRLHGGELAHVERALPITRAAIEERLRGAFSRTIALRIRARDRIAFAGRCELGAHAEYARVIAGELEARSIPALAPAVLDAWRERATSCDDEARFAALRDDFVASVEHPLVARLYGEFLFERFRNHQRYRMLLALRRRLGDRLLLIGDDFVRLGMGGIPSVPLGIEALFAHAAVNLDFGSNSFSRTMYPRSLSVAKARGRLVQLRQADSAVLGSLESRITFRTLDELYGLLERPDALPVDLSPFDEPPRDSLRDALYGAQKSDV